VRHADADAIRRAAYTLYDFYDAHGRYREAEEAFGAALDSLDGEDPAGAAGAALAEMLTYYGVSQMRLDQIERAVSALERSHALYQRLGLSLPPGLGTDPLLILGLMAWGAGNFAEAARLGEAVRAASLDNPGNLTPAHFLLAKAAWGQGQYHAARQHAARAFAFAEELQNRWFMGHCLLELGKIALALDEALEARRCFEAAYEAKSDFGDPAGMAQAQRYLGALALRDGDVARARGLYEASLAGYKDIGDSGGLAVGLAGLGQAAQAAGEPQEAWQYFRQALQIASSNGWTQVTLPILAGLGELLVQSGQVERGLELLGLVRDHPNASQETKDRAQSVLASRAHAGRPASAAAHAPDTGLSAVAASLLQEVCWPPSAGPSAPRSDDGQAQPLVEPLTRREAEVLDLIALGLSNQDIAARLVMSVGTIKWYASQIYGKLAVRRRTQAVARARELGLLNG
jgi:DNA-binding CsgD family transcriptional regulator